MKFSILVALFSVSLFHVGYAQQSTFSALFAFGDSILDTGNNILLPSFAAKVILPPYGRDFPGGIATGRFGNGRVFSDIIAEGLGIKSILPAYRNPMTNNNDLPTGVCFASGGSGLDQVTAGVTGSIWVPTQATDFQNYIGRLNAAVGGDQAKTNQIISNAVYLISAGNNDIAIGYLPMVARVLQYPYPVYTDKLVTWTNDFIKRLYDMGARKFAVMGTLPLGCLPGARSNIFNLARVCEPVSNSVAMMFNQKLSANLNNLGATFPGAKFAYVDMFNSLYGVINNPMPAGFVDVADGCCCTPTSLIPCLDASRYVFWDIAHPTEKAYKTIAPNLVQQIKEKLA